MIFIAVSAVYLSIYRCSPDYRSHQKIHAWGDAIVVGVEDWRARHGHYPTTLADAGLGSPTRYLGGFRDNAYDSGCTFILSIGTADGSEVQHDYSSGAGWYCHD